MASTTIDNLPVDVISKILIRIPAKPLARMRCVSKPWNSLLSQPAFIKSHLRHSIENNDEILVVCASAQMVAHPSKSPHLVIPNFIRIPVDLNLPDQWSTSYFIRGSVNGLICLSYSTMVDNESVIQIWNPSLSAMLTLPPYANTFGYTDKNFIQFGFGFDPKTDDYKVIKFITPKQMFRFIDFFFIDLDDNLSCGKIQVEIYSLRNCSWESITESFLPNVTRIVDRDEIFVDGRDGHLHWLGYVDECGKQETIVAFDLSDESFSEICLPVNNVDRVNTLGILAGKLCVMSCVQDHDCEVWVMNEYGVVESWTKHHAFSQFRFYIAPYGFTLNNEFLFEPDAGDNPRLALYDPNEFKVKYFEFSGRMFSDLKVVEYVDSLVWIAPTGSTSRKD